MKAVYRRTLLWVTGAVAAYLLTVVWYRPVTLGSPLEVDSSWQLFLAHATQNGWQAGQDFIFTYGPLGWVTSEGFHPDLYLTRLLLCAGLTLFAALISVTAVLSLRQPWLVAVCLVLLLLPRNYGPFYLATFAAALLLIRHHRSWRWLVPGMLFLSVVSLTKFSLFMLVAVSVAGILTVRWLESGLLAAARFLACFLAIWTGVWLAAGQSLRSLPLWLSGSLQVASGYAEAMADSRHQIVAGICLAAISLWGAILLLSMPNVPEGPGDPAQAGAETPPGRARIASLVPLALVLLFAWILWQGAFLRCRWVGRVWIFCDWSPAAMLLTWPLGEAVPRRKIARWLLLAVVLVVVVVPLAVTKNPLARWRGAVKHITSCWEQPARHYHRRSTLEKRLEAARRDCALPEIRESVGDHSIDLLSASHQGVMLLNGFNYHPHPVLQSYSAYTPALLEADTRHYQGDDAPRFVLLNIKSLDDRYPTMDDSLALLQVLRSYTPVAVEGGYLLLQRARQQQARSSPAPSGGHCLDRRVAWGEEVDLRPYRGLVIVASIDIRSSILGRLVRLAYRRPAVFMTVGISGKQRRYRIIPAIARCGFLLQPEVVRLTDFPEPGALHPELRLDTLSVSLSRPSRGLWYDDTVRIILREIPRSALACLQPRPP